MDNNLHRLITVPQTRFTAIGKTVAEITCSRSGANRQEIIEKLMQEILNYDAEFRQADASGWMCLPDKPPIS
jgi:hypothetical protein